MNLLKPATNDTAFLKCGITGFAGSGKSFTAAKIAIGLHKHVDSKKPVSWLDTETASSFTLPLFKAEKIELLTAKSRAFVDLIQIMKDAQKVSDILVIDSITHFWIEIVDAYMKKANRTRLRVQDWGPIKQEWRTYPDLFLNSKLHIIFCGRASWDYDWAEDDDGVTQIQKTGTKMSVEKDTGFEPSLSIEMERVRSDEAKGKIGQAFINRAWVTKDRFNAINGKFFDFPTFDSFLPHIRLLNIGGEHAGVDTETSSKDLFDSPDSRSQHAKRRAIALENIQNEIVLHIPGRGAADQQAKIRLLQEVFGSGAWAEIEDMHPERLEAGLLAIKTKFANQEATK